MEKVKVSREVAELLDAQSRDEWSKQFHLISHCKGYTGNGVRCGSIYTQEFKALEALQPLDYAKCMIVGYEVAEKNPDPLQKIVIRHIHRKTMQTQNEKAMI